MPKEEKEKDTRPRIILKRGDILPLKTPLLPNYIGVPLLYKEDAHLKLTKILGIDSVNRNIGKEFHISASAVKYLADVALYSSKYADEDKIPTNPIKTRVLFSGGIQIFKRMNIGDHDINGYQLLRNGEIYTITYNDNIHRGKYGLNTLIFGTAKTFEARCDRVKAIMLAYDDQEAAEDDAEINARHSSFEEGCRAGRWNEQHDYGFGRIL